MRLYLSARADDSRGYDGRLRDEIKRQLPAVSFSADPGHADVMLLLIGPVWVRGQPKAVSRLFAANDPVRCELEEALRRAVRVVPVLIRGAAVPGPDDVPEQLRPLLQFNAWPISHQRFRDDVKALLAGLERPGREARQAGSQIEVTTPNGTLSWILEKDYGPVRLIIDGEDRSALRMLNQSKAFDVDAGAHTVTLRSTGIPVQERSLRVNLAPGQTARLRASRSGWLGTLTLERLS